MKKYIFFGLIVSLWSGINFCLAQDMTGAKNPTSVYTIVADSTVVGQNMKQLQNGMANYLQALQQSNEGLMESAMINLIRMKTQYPDLDYSRLLNQLQYLAEQGRTQSLRFLAFFTRHFLEDPVQISWLGQGVHEFSVETEAFFEIVQK